MTPSSPDVPVLIVGAGLAGLYAAMELEKQGIACQIVDAAPVLGGRIRTILVDGQPVDIGGTGLGPSHLRAHAMVERFALPSRPLTRRGKAAFSINGHLFDADAWEHHPANRCVGEEREILPARMDSYYMQTLLPFFEIEGWLDPKNAQYDIPFADYLRSHGLSEEALRLINMCINTNDIETVSALSMFRDAIKWRSVGFDDPKNFDQYGDAQYKPIRLDGGMVKLPEAMAASLARAPMLGRKVTRIAHGPEGVTATFEDGTALSASRAIVTVPFVALKHVAFDPPLPQPLGEAIGCAAASGNTQFILKTSSRFWEEDGLAPSLWSDTLFERLFVEFNEDDSVNHLRIWINGDNAMRVDAMGAAAGEELLATLARIRPSTAGKLEIVHQVSWGAEPLIGGEKYVMGAGQVTRFARHMAVPAGRVHWAGEHHKSREVGIEAALQSGERAAAEVIAAMQPQAA
ncbi:flavin monoamine oxidase family protein [Novosphingobium resinovorum]|uniref:flavin monoamine oxidase family protein n=1 Tax=Novosphingobium resinovorum TaxID=158500 RepID=UPI002ED5EB6F|nr:FAD-dependent oxidoreductase [Novosphingobium resinovorum]